MVWTGWSAHRTSTKQIPSTFCLGRSMDYTLLRWNPSSECTDCLDSYTIYTRCCRSICIYHNRKIEQRHTSHTHTNTRSTSANLNEKFGRFGKFSIIFTRDAVYSMITQFKTCAQRAYIECVAYIADRCNFCLERPSSATRHCYQSHA